jgi:PAS domain S-box-containing protein
LHNFHDLPAKGGIGMFLWSAKLRSLIGGHSRNRGGTIQPEEIARLLVELEERERRIKKLLESSPDAILGVNSEGQIQLVNRQAEALFQYRREELLGEMIEILLPERHRAKHAIHRAGYSSSPVLRPMGTGLELHGRRKDGSEFAAEISLSPAEMQEGSLVLSIVRDISKRTRAEEALRKSEEKYRVVLQNIQEIVYAVKANGDPLRGAVQFVSPRVRDVVGYEPDEFLEDPGLWFRLIHPDDLPAVVQATGQILATRRPGLREYRLRHKETGDYRWIEDNVVPQFDDSGNLVATFGVARDVTERRRLETHLLEAHKMEAMGRLASGVAHDFNNYLTVILGHSEQMLEGLGATDPRRRNAQLIREAASRSASLTQQLLAFSRQQTFEPKVVDLNAIIWELSEMLRLLVGENIELIFRYGPALWRVKADHVQMDQILMNLAVNAHDAMPKGGRLIIETANAELDDSFAREHFPAQPGSYVLVAVTDTGTGMDEQTKARVFEPFFTTKERGHGTGLGLATVYGVVKQSGGYIWAFSEPGHGTTFRLYLPRVESSAEVATLQPVFLNFRTASAPEQSLKGSAIRPLPQ